MAREGWSRFSLADLVLAVVACGLVAALFATGHNRGQAIVIFVLIVAVFVYWSISRSERTGPTCAQCGRRFIRRKDPSGPRTCPRCGQVQAGPVRWFRAMRIISWCLLVLFLAYPFLEMPLIRLLIHGPAWGRRAVFTVLTTPGLRFVPLLAFLGAAAYCSYLARPRERPCRACGSLVAARMPVGDPALLCPACAARKFTLPAARKAQAKWLAWLLGLTMVVVGVVTFSLPGLTGWLSQSHPAIVFPIVVLWATVASWAGLRIYRHVIRIARIRRLLSEPATLAMARKCAGAEGTIVKEGLATTWYTGPNNPLPMLQAQAAIARTEFAVIVGEPAPPADQPSLRTLCFHDRRAFEMFHRPLLSATEITNLDGLYVPRPCGICSLCTTDNPFRDTDLESSARSLYAYVLMEQVLGSLPAPWLRTGLSKVVSLTTARRGEERARLNRKMIVYLNGNPAWSQHFFRSPHRTFRRQLRRTERTLLRLLGRSKGARAHWRSAHFIYQSWSLVEYLGGVSAPESRQASFRAFLKDKRANTRPEACFFEHFGFGFGSLYDEWHEWVLDRGIGVHEPPGPRSRVALLDRLIPLIRDRRAKRTDRIRAIRGWGAAGFVLGADALIEQLRGQDGIPTQELVWALSMVSGLSQGDDPNVWQGWWDSLPVTAIAPHPDGELEVAIRS